MLLLKRTYYPDRTEGEIMLPDGQFIYALERPWLNNQVSVSCIPEGVYIIDRNTTGRFQWYEVSDVPKRTHIEIHPANRVSQLEGCIAPCMELTNGQARHSKQACDLLLKWFGDFSWTLRIIKKETN